MHRHGKCHSDACFLKIVFLDIFVHSVAKFSVLGPNGVLGKRFKFDCKRIANRGEVGLFKSCNCEHLGVVHNAVQIPAP